MVTLFLVLMWDTNSPGMGRAISRCVTRAGHSAVLDAVKSERQFDRELEIPVDHFEFLHGLFVTLFRKNAVDLYRKTVRSL
jgi:hypothetical protein